MKNLTKLATPSPQWLLQSMFKHGAERYLNVDADGLWSDTANCLAHDRQRRWQHRRLSTTPIDG